MKIVDDVYYIGVNDYKLDLFEGQYPLPHGMAYNSYVIIDEKIAVFDTVEHNFASEWLANLAKVLNGKKPDYLIIHHMEPDHSSSIDEFLEKYPDTCIVGNSKVFQMLSQFFPEFTVKNKLEIKEKDNLSLGKTSLTFFFAPMVHWPEVTMTYDATHKILFSADAFGKFGALDFQDDWVEEARRYYIGIVGKYGKQVQATLKKFEGLEIKYICSLHGPILSDNIESYLNYYNIWSSYNAETNGVLIAYTSMYGHTKEACEILYEELKKNNCQVEMYDLARTDVFQVIAKAFQYDKLVLASPTYNTEVLPFMNTFLNGLLSRNFQNRKVALIENGSWAISAAKKMKEILANAVGLEFYEKVITIKSKVTKENHNDLQELAKELMN